MSGENRSSTAPGRSGAVQGGARRQLPRTPLRRGTSRSLVMARRSPKVRGKGVCPSSRDCPGQTRREAGTQSQGAQGTETAPPPSPKTYDSFEREAFVKQILARFTFAVALLACTALTLGAGIR